MSQLAKHETNTWRKKGKEKINKYNIQSKGQCNVIVALVSFGLNILLWKHILIKNIDPHPETLYLKDTWASILQLHHSSHWASWRMSRTLFFLSFFSLDLDDQSASGLEGKSSLLLKDKTASAKWTLHEYIQRGVTLTWVKAHSSQVTFTYVQVLAILARQVIGMVNNYVSSCERN